MCRFVAYMGKPMLLNEVLYKPKNSLINQSIKAIETEEPLNGDGFGVGWYCHDIDFIPAIFTSIMPAWNNRNLMNIAPKIRSECFFAHVRAASSGSVSVLNCHPFAYKRFLFMHNGSVGDFPIIKRQLRRELSDEAYNMIQGQTDSEHFFALFIDIFHQRNAHHNAMEIAQVLEETIVQIKRLQSQLKTQAVSYLNLAITDGRNLVALRYISSLAVEAPSLHFCEGEYFACKENGNCYMQPSKNTTDAILIASEKLSGHNADWKDIPVNHMLIVNDSLESTLKKVTV